MDPAQTKELRKDEPVKSPEDAYLEQMTPFEKAVLVVAKRQLGMSFDLKRSIGFLEFVQKK